MKRNKDVIIKDLSEEHSKELTKLLQTSDSKHSEYFIPFDFNYETINKILSNKKDDKYFGIFIEEEIVGFYMLRGFDEGYEIPSYGVWISQEYSNLGLGKLTLYHALSFCKVNKIKKIILSVHPDNIAAKGIYETAGFIFTGEVSEIGHLKYEKTL